MEESVVDKGTKLLSCKEVAEIKQASNHGKHR